MQGKKAAESDGCLENYKTVLGTMSNSVKVPGEGLAPNTRKLNWALYLDFRRILLWQGFTRTRIFRRIIMCVRSSFSCLVSYRVLFTLENRGIWIFTSGVENEWFENIIMLRLIINSDIARPIVHAAQKQLSCVLAIHLMICYI